MKTQNPINEFFDNLSRKKGTASFVSSLVAIGVGLVLGLIILLISNPSEAFPGFLTMLSGGFNKVNEKPWKCILFCNPYNND